MTTIFEKLKIVKSDLTDTTLKNYVSFYNIAVKYFKSEEYRNMIKLENISKPVWNPPRFFENIESTQIFLNLKYSKLSVRLARYNAWVAICLAYNIPGLADRVKSIKNKIEEDEKLKSKQALESRTFNSDSPDKNYLDIFLAVKKKLIYQAELVENFYEESKTGYTLIELQQINKLAFMMLVANAFLLDEDKLLLAENPPRRLEYRFLKYIVGKKNLEGNYLNKIHPRINSYRIVYNIYKKQAQKSLGEQRLRVNSDLMKILKMYIDTHKNIRKSDILFPQNLYKQKDEKIYAGYQMSRIIKKYFGYTIDDLRHAYISKAYQTDYIPDHKTLEGLSYRMAHSVKTAMANYRQFSKIK